MFKFETTTLILKTILQCILYHFSNGSKGNSERLSNLLKVTQPIQGEDKIRIQVCFWLKSQCLLQLTSNKLDEYYLPYLTKTHTQHTQHSHTHTQSWK